LSIPNIKCFSVHCEQTTNVYHEIIVPFLRRMSNLEKLSLNLDISVRNTFIDGNDLKQNIINHLSLLKRFEFHICSNIYNSNQIHLQSKEDIQHTFRDFKDDQVISYIDHFEEREWRLCHIYLNPEKLRYYYLVTNHFPGGLFTCVRKITLKEEHPFEHEFFLRIAQSFPFITFLTIENSKSQNNKLSKESENNNQVCSTIKYPYLTALTLYFAHDDYIEEFLIHTKICLPDNTVHINIYLEQLERVTYNFTRDATRINCAKLRSLCLNGYRLPEYAKNYFPNV
ncbi:unnamed protein product, partial [Rotaria magnacalcarata]